MLFLDFPNQGAAREYWDFCGLGMSAGSRGAILSMKKLMIAAQWVARNLQGGCGWEFPCVWSRQNIAKVIANRILNKLQSFQKKRHTKIPGKVGGLGLFYLCGITGFIVPKRVRRQNLAEHGSFFNSKSKDFFNFSECAGVGPITSEKTWLFSGLHADSTNFVLLVLHPSIPGFSPSYWLDISTGFLLSAEIAAISLCFKKGQGS